MAHQREARDGYKQFIERDLPQYKRPQPFETDPTVRTAVRNKLATVRNKGYISKGSVASLTSYFCVPKGDQDIHMVYNATKSKLNSCLWAPNFGLPTVDILTRNISCESWMGDLDIGEMFLNFCLHPDLQPFCGVDLKPYFLSERGPSKTLWERWVRCMMGLKSSPYFCIKALLIMLEFICGDRKCTTNPFQWERTVTNLPGDENYCPAAPRLQRLRFNSQELAALVLSYVEDLRAAAGSESLCWEVMHKVSSRASYLGIQIATRKTRPQAKQPGPWAGSMVIAQEEGVGVKATQDKWNKTQQLLKHTLQLIDLGTPIDRKVLESYRGSLVYLQRTYPAITPYVKGFHLTINSWRSDRDLEGWRIPWGRDPPLSDPALPPSVVMPVPRFRDDVLALLRLFDADTPPIHLVRSQAIRVACYSFADASGTGFGRTLSIGTSLEYTHGVWEHSMDTNSSNYRELINLVETLEQGVANQSLHNVGFGRATPLNVSSMI